MCGIAGIIKTDNSQVNSEEIKKMTDIIAHRGPDGEGFYFGKNFAFGHRRLAIIDLTDAGKQPMDYEGKRGKYVITYNGEVYNYLELKEELMKDGYVFNTHTDTEVILASYDKWGPECVKRFNGMWAFAIFNEQRNEIFISRDRFGIKPLYYTTVGNTFAFGSEIKQFTVLPMWQARMNKARVYDFLVNGLADHTGETMFDGVYNLRPGHYLLYDLSLHKYNIYKWYDLNDVRPENDITFEEASERFRELIFDSIRIHMRSDVKVGSCLSGGLDSSTVVCVMNRLLSNKENQEVVSAGSRVDKYNELDYAIEVAKHTGVKQHVVFPEFDELVQRLDEIVWHHDEPFGSTSIFAGVKVFEKARERGLIVMLDGQGADEILAGYHHVFGPYLAWLLKNGKFVKFLRDVNSISQNGYSKRYLIEKAVVNSLPKFFIKFLRKIRGRSLLFEKPNGIMDVSLTFNDLREYRISMFNTTSLIPLLRYEDRNSMKYSVEGRVPFLDYRLVEFMISLPEEFLVFNGMTKALLRHSMRGIVPDKVLDRRDKLGFATPEEVWVKTNKEFFLDGIEKSIRLSNGLVKPEFLDYVKNVLAGKNPYDFMVWRVFILGRWIERFNVVV